MPAHHTNVKSQYSVYVRKYCFNAMIDFDLHRILPRHVQKFVSFTTAISFQSVISLLAGVFVAVGFVFFCFLFLFLFKFLLTALQHHFSSCVYIQMIAAMWLIASCCHSQK